MINIEHAEAGCTNITISWSYNDFCPYVTYLRVQDKYEYMDPIILDTTATTITILNLDIDQDYSICVAAMTDHFVFTNARDCVSLSTLDTGMLYIYIILQNMLLFFDVTIPMSTQSFYPLVLH